MRGCWPKALASARPCSQNTASAPTSAPAAPIEASQTKNPPNQRHASLRASPAACERLLAVWRISAWDSLIAPLAAHHLLGHRMRVSPRAMFSRQYGQTPKITTATSDGALA